jgi:hypothetical protein
LDDISKCGIGGSDMALRFIRTLLALLLLTSPAFAWKHHGLYAPIPNLGRVTVNVPPGGLFYINIAQAGSWLVSRSNCGSPPCVDSNGNPNQTLTSNVFSNPPMPGGYYGSFTWSWSGFGGMIDNSALPRIFTSISPSGAVQGIAGTSGDVAQGTNSYTGSGGTGVSNASIVFQYGWLIQSISNNGSGLIRITTKTNYVNSCSGVYASGTDQNGNTGRLVNITGAAANTGANGLWAFTNCTASTFDLVGSTFTNAQASPAGTAAVGNGNTSFALANGIAFSSFSNLVIAKTGDIPTLQAGHYWDTTYVSQLQTLMNPGGDCLTRHDCGWLRFMDFNGTQKNWEQDYSQRMPVAAISYLGQNWRPAGYYVGQITNTSNALVASNPSASPASGGYVDGEIVQGYVSSTNTSTTPTLAITGRGGAKPILDDSNQLAPLGLMITGVPVTPGTDTMTFTFGAGGSSWFNSGSNCTGTYTTQANDTSISQLTANLQNWFSGQTVGSNTPLTCLTSSSISIGGASNSVAISPQFYTPSAQAGRFTASYSSVADPNIISVGSIISITLTTNAATAAGNAVLHFASVPQPLIANAGGSGQCGLYIVDQTAGTVLPTNACTNAATSTTVTMGQNATGAGVGSGDTISFGYFSQGSTSFSTFKYNYLLDAWMYTSSFNFSPPMEVAADLANQVGANVWWNWNFNSSSYVQSVTTNFATNLTSGLKFGTEIANENWNCFGPKPCQEYFVLGVALKAPTGANQAQYSYAGLRAAQFFPLAKAAWTSVGRSGSDFLGLAMTQASGEGVNTGFDLAFMKGKFIGASNTFVANYGGLGGVSGGTATVSTDFSAVGTRPVDYSNAEGIAPYWASPWFGDVAGDINGTVAANAPWLQAQLDFANGLITQSYAEITNTFNGTTRRTDGSGSGQLTFPTYYNYFLGSEAMCAQYDTYRISVGLPKLIRLDYEGAPQWGFGTNATQGTNSATDATSLSALASRFSALGWDVSAYVLSGNPTDYSGLAQQLLNFTQAWKNSSSYANLVYNNYYQALAGVSGQNREAHAAQYGYNASIWGIFPSDFHLGNSYQNFNAIQTQNRSLNWLLKRDLDPAANDNDPLFLEKAA